MKTTAVNYTPIQLKLPVDMERIIEINDSVYTFNEVDIRFIWLRDEMKAPSYATLCDFINQELSCSLEEIVQEIDSYIFTQENVDLDHVYIDETKIEANANKYSWVWKKSCITSVFKEFEKITKTFQEANETVLQYLGLKLGVREEYAVEYLAEMLEEKCRRKANFLRLWLVYTFFREKLSTALMGKKKQTLSISGKSLRFPFGVI